jgi:hypothetical protein
MKSEAVRLAQSNERIALINAARDVFTNPAVVAIAGVVLVEYLQSSVNQNGQRVAGGGWMGSNVGTALEASLGAYLLAPSIQTFAKQIGPVAEAFGKIAPTALMAAGG